MNIWRLVGREIVHRKLNFGFGLFSVLAATAMVVGGMTLLGGHRTRMDALVAKRLTDVTQTTKDLEDAMRIITKRMGFNVVIMPLGQNLDDPFADDYASKFMPESYADKLAESPIITVNHLLPALEQRVQWIERDNREIFLIGIKGQVPIKHRDAKNPKKPIMQPVPKDGMVVGSSLAIKEKIRTGQMVRLMGHELKVVKINPRKGDKRDMTAWIDLALMQKLTDKPKLINSIWALECSCAMGDVGQVRAELGKILPNVLIQEQGEKALARAELRKKAADEAAELLANEEEDRNRVIALGKRFRMVFIPLIIVGSAVWVGMLALGNVRDRRYEIGVLRALGVRSNQIMMMFLSRAVFVGLIGAAIGCVGGFLLGSKAMALWVEEENMRAAAQYDMNVLIWVLVLSPVLSAMACWLPAMLASQQDPAIVLREE